MTQTTCPCHQLVNAHPPAVANTGVQGAAECPPGCSAEKVQDGSGLGPAVQKIRPRRAMCSHLERDSVMNSHRDRVPSSTAVGCGHR